MNDSLGIVVVGAGIGGLGAALALSRAGHSVTLVERDDTPMPRDVEGAFEWDRRGAPQVRHPHAFLGLARTILRDRYPDVLRALADAGVQEVSMAAAPPFPLDDAVRAALVADDDLQLLACRRTTFEWVLRRLVLAEPNVEVELGRGVAGLLARPSAPDATPVVTGVVLEDGTTIDADLVIASSGRRGDVPAWFEELGVSLPETSSDAGVVYYSRFYRSADRADFGFRGGFGAGLIAGVIGADAGTYSITAVVDRNDRELRAHLKDSDRFDATMRLLPELADVAAADGEPIHPVHCMTGLINRRRQFTDVDGSPKLVGVLACGDAHTCTNPAYGRGMSLALRQAVFIADSIGEAEDLVDVGRRYEAACAAQVEPWYHFSVMTDRLRSMSPDPFTQSSSGSTGGGFDLLGALSGAADDAELVRHVMRVFNLLELPETLMTLLPELRRQSAEGPTKPPRPPSSSRRRRPTRDELLGVVA